MKKFLGSMLALSLAVCMLAGCGGSPAPQDTPEDAGVSQIPEKPRELPGQFGDFVGTGGITSPPQTIFETTATENGLAGTLYRFDGTVKEVVSDDESKAGYGYMNLDTEYGEIYIVDLAKAFAEQSQGALGEADIRPFLELPEAGDIISVYAEYAGYSGVLQSPSAYYGGSKYLGDVVTKLLLDDALTKAPEGSGDAGKMGAPAAGPDAGQDAEATEPQKPAEPVKTETMGQKNALKSAKNYISIMAFSHDGLIGQLEYEGYSNEEATYAADNCGADWNEQAAKSAKGYLELMSFSRSGLIDQLKYEGFTQEQAEYGATAAGY